MNLSHSKDRVSYLWLRLNEVPFNGIGCLAHSTCFVVWLFCGKSCVERVVCALGLEGWLRFLKAELAGSTLPPEGKAREHSSCQQGGRWRCCTGASHGPHRSRLQGTEVAGAAGRLPGSQEGLSQPAWAAATELQLMVAFQEPRLGWADDCFSEAARYLNFYGNCSDFKS